MKQFLIACIGLLLTDAAGASNLSGTVRTKSGAVLPFSSILVKGTTRGVTANVRGQYSVQLPPGEYTLVCQFIGHKTAEKTVKLGSQDQTVDFILEEQQYNLKEVVVKSGGEDPAYAIIRHAIEKRAEHRREVKKFRCEVYIKGQLQLRSYPKSVMGRTVDFEDGDTSKRKMIFLSETVARYAVDEPGKEKVEVISTKLSGRSNGFGLSDPQIVSFYDNNIEVGEDLNPRGFISPIANGALNFYRYKFEGTFYENGKEISRIKVIPRRKYEPLFTGHINIIEDEWRIYSVDLMMLREQQMQLLDTLRIQQLYVPSGNVWVIKNQVIYPSGKILGFDFFGNFVQVYDKFDMNPVFDKKFFNHIILKFLDSSNKKPMAYWDSIRPVPLLAEEARDYKKKDSLEQVRKDPRYLDSLDRKHNKITVGKLLLSGQTISVRKKRIAYAYRPLLSSLNYNTVEGAVIRFSPSFRKRFDSVTEEGRKFLYINSDLRYGITNTHLNPSVSIGYSFGKKYFQNLTIAGGRTLFQFNNANPVDERINSISTLDYKANHLKIYEAGFVRAAYSAGIGNGLTLGANFQFQDRSSLENLADPVNWRNPKNREYTPNYPITVTAVPMPNNRASLFTVGITWHPGADYIEMPGRKINLGSRWPVVTASVTRGISGLFGSEVDYTRWRFGLNDDISLKLGGKFRYNIMLGGFFDAAKVFIPDYQHFLGNQTVISSRELGSFQLAPYYQYSNTARINLAAHAEYHLNGLLSNKIPGFKKLNWFFVTGVNALHIDQSVNYFELLFGIENIAKIIRVDFVQGFESGGGRPSGFRVGLPLF